MSVTGALLTYQRQITAWADMRGYRNRAGRGERLSADAIVAKVAPSTARSVADGRDGAIGTDGAGIAGRRRRPAAVRRSLHGRRARRGKRARRARVLPRRWSSGIDTSRVGREPSPRTRDHRRVESACSLHRRQRPLPVVAAHVDMDGSAQHHLVHGRTAPARRAISTGTTRSASGRRFRSRSSLPVVS